MKPAQASSTRAAVRASSQQGAAERQEWSTEESSSEPRGANPPRPRSEAPSPIDRPLGSGGCWVFLFPQVQAESPGAMASPSGSPEDKGKLRGRDGRQRREEEDAPPEEKRLRLGLEGGSAAQEEGEDAPRLGREETGTQTGVEGRGVSEQGHRRDAAGGWLGRSPSLRRQVQVGNWAATPAGRARCDSLQGPPEKLVVLILMEIPFLFM